LSIVLLVPKLQFVAMSQRGGSSVGSAASKFERQFQDSPPPIKDLMLSESP
jgi:hypothetical protein